MTERQQQRDADARDDIATALAQIQRRRELLSRGAVADQPHADAPVSPAHEASQTTATATGHRGQMLQHAAMGMFPSLGDDDARTSTHASAYPQQQQHDYNHHQREHKITTGDPVDARAALRNPSATVHQRITWVRKPVQRLYPKQSAVEDVGSIEFATMASLASVRRLLDQFYPLPNKREYEFVHPLQRIRIDPSDELNTIPVDFPSILFVVLPQLHRPRPASPLVAVPTRGSLSMDQVPPLAALQAITAGESVPRSTTAPEKTRKAASSSSAQQAAVNSSQPAAYRDFQFRNRTFSGVRCNITIREFPAKRLFGIKVQIKEGMFAGRTTPIQWLSVDRVDLLLKTTAATSAAPDEEIESMMLLLFPDTFKLQMLISTLELRFPVSALEDPCIVLGDLRSEPSATVGSPSTAAQATTPVTRDDNQAGILPQKEVPQARVCGPESSLLVDRRNDSDSFNNSEVNAPTVDQHSEHDVPRAVADFKEIDRGILSDYTPDISRREKTASLSIEASADVVSDVEVDYPDVAATSAEQINPAELQESVNECVPDASSTDEQSARVVTLESGRPRSRHESATEEILESTLEALVITEVLDDFELSDFEYLPELGESQTEHQLSERSSSSSEESPVNSAEETVEDIMGVEPEVMSLELGVPPLADAQVSEAQIEGARVVDEIAAQDEPLTPRRVLMKAEHLMDYTQLQKLEEANSVAEARVLRYLRANMEVFSANFEVAQQPDASVTANSLTLFTAEQLHKSLLQYGINHLVFGLNGVFLALEEDLSILAEPLLSSIDALLKKYILTLLPSWLSSTITSAAEDLSDLAWLFQVENTLNVLSDMRSWHEPTQIRVFCIEKHSTNAFFSPSGATGDSKATPALRLSDKDRELLSGVHANEHLFSALDVWISDGLEILYLFMYAFLNSSRNAGANSVAKLNFCRTRVERVQITVQKVISMDPTAWRKMEFLFSEVEDFAMAARIKELTTPFLNNQKTHLKAIEACLFFPALAAFISRKAGHISRNIMEFIKRESLLIEQSVGSPSSPSARSKCLRSFREQLEGAKLDASSHFEGYLRNVGLKTIDMDRMNKSRSARSLSRVNLSGKFSLRAQHQCELMGSDFALHLRPRWNQDRLKAAQMNRYFFHGEASIAMEAVYVRRKVDLTELQEKSWENLEHYVEDDIREAFRLLSIGVPSKSGTLLLAIGVNALHLDLLEANSSFNAMVMENPKAQSLSMGYFVSKDADIAAIRVIFRVHVDPELLLEQHQKHSGARDDGSISAVTECAKTFLYASSKEGIVLHALEINYLSFLFGCLDESREQRWRDIAFGGDFFDHLQSAQVNVQYPREIVLNCMGALIERIPKSLAGVTKRNLEILTKLVIVLSRGSPSVAGGKLIDTVLQVLKFLCSRRGQSTGPAKIEPFTDFQRKFAAEDGLKFLIDAADLVAATSSSRQLVIEEMVLALMQSSELCSSKAALLVHWRHWMAYYVENSACASSRANREFVPLLLQEIHQLFFAQRVVDWDTSRVTMVSCGCGCKGSAPDSLKSVVGIMKLFLALLLKDKGVLWGQDGMKGPSDCLVFFSWTLSAEAVSIPLTTYRPLQLTIFEALCAFLDQMTSGDRLLHFLSDMTPTLLNLLCTVSDAMLQRGVLKTLSLSLELSLEKTVWKNSVQSFVESLYQIIQVFWSVRSSGSAMNTLMADTLFHRDHALTWVASNHERDIADELQGLLHEEHAAVLQTRAHSNLTRGRSLLESLMTLMTLPPESPLHPFCQVPILVALGWLLNSAALAEDCATLGLDLVLQELLEGEHTPACILAARVCCVLHFQLMTVGSKRASSDNLLKRLGNALTITMGAGARLTLSHQDASGGSEQLCFSADQHDSFLILQQFVTVNAKSRANYHRRASTEGITSSAISFQEQIWGDCEWGNPDRAMTAKLGAFLNLLAVFSCLTNSVRQMKHSEELKQIQQLLWRFIRTRDREFVSEGQMTLYLFALRNIVFALGTDLLGLAVPMYNDLVFLQKLLSLSRQKSSKLIAELASGLLWALASAYESTEVLSLPFIAEFDDPDETTALSSTPIAPGSVPQVPKTSGIVVLAENILAKFNSGGAIDCDVAALSLLLQNKLCDDTFFRDYDYVFVIRLLDNVYQTGLSGGIATKVDVTKLGQHEKKDLSGHMFGTTLFYTQRLTRQVKEMIQLCRLAHSCLLALVRSKPESIESMIPRTKSKVLRLLLDQNDVLLLHQVLLCVIVHLKAHPLKCTELFEPSMVDTILALAFAPTEYSPLRAAAFTCLRLMLLDPKCQVKPHGLDDKLFSARRSIVLSLRDDSFEVKKQALILAVDFVFHIQQDHLVREFAEVFTESEENKTLLADMFTRLSTDVMSNPETGYVLQLLVRLVVRLDLIQLTDTEQLVAAICVTIRVQSDSTFLRPLLCNCLFRIASEKTKASSFARKSRLNTITDLLTERLTLGELRSIGGLLTLLAEQHEGVRQYLKHFESGCIAKISHVLSSFTQISTDGNAPATDTTSSSQYADELYEDLPSSSLSSDQITRYVVKMAAGKSVFISHFTDDIYEQFLHLLVVLGRSGHVQDEHFGCSCEVKQGCAHCDVCDLIAKAECGRSIARFLISRRVLLRTSYDLAYFLGSSGIEAKQLERLSLQLLSSLSFSHQSRIEIMRGFASDWSWVRWIIDRCVAEKLEPGQMSGLTNDRAIAMATTAVMCLGRFCAEKVVAFYVLSQREFLLTLFSHISLNQTADSAPGLNLQCASLFTIARLAEYRKVVLDPLFQEKAGSLLARVEELQHDHISLANAMILTRNFAHFTPGMQSRIADPSNLSALVELLLSHDEDVPYIAAEVLAHALYFEKPKSHARKVVGAGSSSSKVALLPNTLEPAPSAEDLRRAFLPGWRRLFLVSTGEGDGDMHLQVQGLDDVCSTKDIPTREKLLQVVLELHLREPLAEMDEIANKQHDGEETSIESDAIVVRDVVSLSRPPRLLQSVLPAPFRNFPEPHDSSFRGSAHLWRFLRKLWLLTLRENTGFGVLSSSSNQLLDHVQVILVHWKAQTSVAFSNLTHERRAQFLGFIVSVMKTFSECLMSSNVISSIADIADELITNPTTSGVAYELLYTVCMHSPHSADRILQHFIESDGDRDGNGSSQMSRAVRSLVQGVRLEHLVVRLSVSKIKGQETDNTVTMLDPRVPSSSTVAYAIGLLNLMSVRSPDMIPWFIESQGCQVLFDLLLMDSSYVSSLPPSIKDVFHSSLIELLVHILHLRPDTDRFIIADARILHRIVRLVYSLKSHTQLAALKLLQSLSKSPRTRDVLFRLEYFSSSLAVVEDWMADCAQVRCTDLQVTPPLRPRENMELAHLLQLPFFLDLSTIEIMRLSMCFVESRLVEEGSLMIVVSDGRFGKIPAWMVSDVCDSKTDVHQKKICDHPVMKRIDEDFKRVISKRHSEGSLMMYKIQCEGYLRSTTPLVRRHVAKRIEQFVTRDEQFFGHTHHKHASSGLISRACRLLIEDRAELVRRVAFTKQLAEESVFQVVTKRRLSDLLTLLTRSQLFAGIARDKLACLVYRLSPPTQVTLSEFENAQAMPLIILIEENPKYTVHIKSQLVANEDAVIVGSLHRGSFLGFPPWLTGERGGDIIHASHVQVDRISVLAVIIPLEDLEAELGKSDTQLLIQRCEQAIQDGGAQQLLNLMTSSPVHSNEPHCPIGERGQLQRTALLLLQQLVSARDFAARMLTNTWAIQIVCEVSVSTLSFSIVTTALEILYTLVEDEVLCKRFCALEIPFSELETSSGDIPSWTSNARTFLAMVHHFPLSQWGTQVEVLTWFFRIQSHVFKLMPMIFKSIADIWTVVYLRQCQLVLKQDRYSKFQTAEIVAGHLIPAVIQQPGVLLEGCRATSMHVDVLNVLLSSPEGCSRPCVSLLGLFCFFCSDIVLREQIWASAGITIKSFDPVLRTVATDLITLSSMTVTSHKQRKETEQMVRTYCEFVIVICASDIDEARDLAFRDRVEAQFSILSALIQLLSSFESLRVVLLRATGVICLETPSNYSKAQTATILVRSTERRIPFVEYMMQGIEGLQTGIKSVERSSEVEAILLCVQALSHSYEGAKTFSQKGFVSMVMGFLSDLPGAPSSRHLLIWRSLVLTLQNFVEFTREDFLLSSDEAAVGILMRFLSQLSNWYRIDREHFILGRLLRDFLRFLVVYMANSPTRAQLYTMYFEDPVKAKMFTEPCYHWIISNRNTVNSDEGQAKLRKLGCELEIASLDFLSNLVQDPEITRVLAVQGELVVLVNNIFQKLADDAILVDQAQAASAILRFLCFFMEQLAMIEISVFEITDGISIPTLIQIFQSSEASNPVLEFTMRMLWLFQIITRGEMKNATRSGITLSEIQSIAEVATSRSRLIAESPKLLINILGLTAETLRYQHSDQLGEISSDNQARETGQLIRLLRKLLASCCGQQCSELMIKIVRTDGAQSASEDQYSAMRYVASLRPTTMALGVLHQFNRCFRHMHQEDLLQLLGKERPTRVDCAFQGEVFTPSLRLLQEVCDFHCTEYSRMICEDSLGMLENVFRAFTLTSSDEAELQCRLRAYRAVAGQEQLLQAGFKILQGGDQQLQAQAMSLLAVYCDKHLTVWYELQILRCQDGVDLLDTLVTCVCREPNSEQAALSYNLAVNALRVFNALVEYSHATAVHAYKLGCLERLIPARATTEDDFHRELELECLRAFFYVLRANPDKQVRNALVVRHLWDMLCRWLVESPPRDANSIMTSIALKCVAECRSVHNELADLCRVEWDLFGERLIYRLADVMSQEETQESEKVDVRKFAVRALDVLCSNKQILDSIWKSIELVASCLETLKTTSKLYTDRIRLITRMIESQRRDCEMMGGPELKPFTHLLSKYEALNSIPVEERCAYLELLPALISPATREIAFQASTWKVIVENLLFFLQRGTPVEAAAAHTAFQVFLQFEVNRASLSDAFPILNQIWSSLYRSLEHNAVEANVASPVSIVSFIVPGHAARGRGNVDIRARVSSSVSVPVSDGKPKHLELRSSCRDLRLAITTILQLGHILVSLHSDELYCAQLCISLLLSQVYYVDEVADSECLALSEVLSSVFIGANDVFALHSELWMSSVHFTAFSCWLIRAVSSNQFAPLHVLALSLLSRLLEASRRQNDEHSSEFDIRCALATANIDVIDTVSWSKERIPEVFAIEHSCIALWCNILRFACADTAFSRRVMSTQLLHRLVWGNLKTISNSEGLSNPSNVAILALFKTICNLHDDDPTFVNDNMPLFELVADRCFQTAALLQDPHPVKYDAIELLSGFLRHGGHFRERMWRSCFLCHGEHATSERKVRRMYLRGISGLILDCQDNDVALEQSLHVLFQLCTSELGIDPLLVALRGMAESVIDIIQVALRETVGTSRKLNLRLQGRSVSAELAQLTDFLPSDQLSALRIKGCRIALNLLQLCMGDSAFADSLQNETEIFCELFAALGCPDWEIASSAAAIIASTLIWPTSNARDANDETEDDNVDDLLQYTCIAEPTGGYQYRRLTFFALVNDQAVFDIEPDDTGLSSIFLILTAWLQFYSKNLQHLQREQPGSSETKIQELRDGDDLNCGDETPRATTTRNLYEKLLFSILEVLLYLLTNYFSEVFDTTEDVPIPEEKMQHSELCVYLLTICKRSMVADQPIAVVKDYLIRCKSLSLLRVLCSFELYYSAQVFTQDANVFRVLSIVESTKSAQEQQEAVRLLYDVSSYSEVKDLFVSHQTLLLHISSWLENPRLELLQPFAIGILKNLATKSVGQRRQNVFVFAPSFQDQLAQTLFQGKQYGRKASIARFTVPKQTISHRATLRVSLHCLSQAVDQGFLPIKVKAHIQINQRVFQLQSQIQSLTDHVTHQILLDDMDSSIVCTVTLKWNSGVGTKAKCKAKQTMTHSLTSSDVSSLRSTIEPQETITTLLTANESVVVNLSDKLMGESSDDLGSLGRLLRHEGIDQVILADATSIVSELCKNHGIFCDPKVKLWSHVLSAMASSSTRAHAPHRSIKVDLSCLHSLSSWFWSKPSVAFFKTTMVPLLLLIRGMRNHGFARSQSAPEAPRQARLARYDRTAPLQFVSPGESLRQQQNFLTALMEWVAAIEVPEVTENCLNILFLENTDVLLFLCSETFPARSARASFFLLVATAVRTNMVHCEVFATKHALDLLSSILDAPSSPTNESDASRAEMLQHATRVIAKISRHATARDKFVRHGGMHMFGRVAFQVFRGKWLREIPQQAAENLVLATSFLCDFVTQHSFVDPTNRRDMRWLNLMMTQNDDPTKSSHSLTVVETLLHFLGHNGEPVATRSNNTNRSDRFFSSFDRLAASILSSLVEKHPRRVSFERHLLELMHHTVRDSQGEKHEAERLQSIFTSGLRRCIVLTKWDFGSDLNVIRRTYYSGICAGVRMRVVPPQCRTVFRGFDQDFLISGAPQYQQSESAAATFGDTTVRTDRGKDGFSSIPNNESEDGIDRVNLHNDSEDDGELSDKEVKELLAFVANHNQLVETLTENQKKHLSHSIKVADRNSRLLVACHAILSLALDLYVDMVAVVQTEKSKAVLSHHRHCQHGDLKRIAVIQQWLMSLEELSGLVCCSLHELDLNYYGPLAQQLHSLVSELPTFLHKMERIQSKMHTLLLFLRNFNTVLKRIANKNELKGVAGNGFGVALEAKMLCEQLREMESEVAEALAYVLTSKSAHERFLRMLVAMNYMWKRVLGSASLSEFMEGGTQTPNVLWKKLRQRITNTLVFVANPGPFIVTQGSKMLIGVAALMKTLLAKEYAPSAAFHNVNKEDKPVIANTGSETESSNVKLGTDRDVSYFPFCSMESLLDHFGYTSLRSKKMKQTFTIPKLKHQVLALISQAFALPESVVEKLSVLQLETNFQRLAVDETVNLLQELRKILDEADAGIQIRIIDKTPLELSLWRFIVRPIQRARLYRLRLLVDDFMASSLSAQHEMLKEYRQEEEAHVNRKESLFAMVVSPSHKNSTLATQNEQSVQKTQASHHLPTVIKKGGRNQTSFFETLKSCRLKFKIGAMSEDATSSNRQTASSGNLFDADLLITCDSVSSADPLSEEMAVEKLRRTLHDQKKRHQGSFMGIPIPYHKFYLTNQRMPQFVTRIQRRLQLMVLLVAFWRQEELTSDLKNEMLARAFDSQQERDAYFLSYHVKKAFAELVRIWMPESGDLGLLIWQSKKYFLGGTLAAVLIVYLFPRVYGGESDSERNLFMTHVIVGYVACVYMLTMLSIFVIVARRHVLQERDRIRFSPLAKYYQNALAIVSIAVELVQLNSLSFERTDTDNLSKLIQWLGALGITDINIAQVELKGILCFMALVVWFVMLKAANKFQETSPVLNHLFTKDLPTLLHGFLYMSTISTFFSFLSCIDCQGKYDSRYIYFTKCQSPSTSSSPPFLLSYEAVTCWGDEHRKYALMGIWGITFFLPIGLLSQGMNQVLFQAEKLDIKYAPVMLLLSQLVKAVSVTGKAFFLSSSQLAFLGFAGNLLLCFTMISLKGSSLWFIKLIKSGIYAASSWSSVCAIYRIQTNSVSGNTVSLIYIGWLTVAAVVASMILLRLRRQADRKQREDRAHWAMHRSLLAAATTSIAKLSHVEQAFLTAAKKRAEEPTVHATMFAKQAQQLSADEPPVELERFMRRARGIASGKRPEEPARNAAASAAVFMRNARESAKQLESAAERRQQKNK